MAWEPAPGAILGGKYCLERSLAAGGMGSVWIARHIRLDAYVAVKLMGADIGHNPSSVARFEREAKACAQLQSAHVVGVHDFGVEDGTPYMVMELLRGEDLGDRIERVGRLTPAEAVPVAVSIGKALRVAHEAGIIHRDLKPRNIFIAQQGDDEVIKLVDFGIARETKSRLVDDRTASGVVMGSPFHMSPEQAQALPVDHRTDLWALGVVLYRLVTGFRPFDGDNVTSVLVTICTTPHPLPSELSAELPPALDAFFAKALAKDAARRFQTAREMVDAFVAAVDGRTEPASGPRGVVPLPTPSWPSSPQVPAAPGSLPSGSQSAVPPQAPASFGAQAGTPHGSAPLAFDPRAQRPGITDASASHALRAVSTGAQTPTAPAGGSRVGLLLAAIAAAVALGAIAFYLVEATRSPPAVGSAPPPPASSATPSDATPATASAAPSAPPPASVPSEVAPTPSAAPVVQPSASASESSPTPSASVAAAPPRPATPPRGGPRPPPPQAKPTAAPAGPAIDPFTGLPVAR